MKPPKDIIAIRRNVPNVMVVTWVINNICDRSCAYCPPKLHNGSNHNYDWNLAREFWKELIDRYENIHVSIAGGEPTLSPHLKEAIDMIFNKIARILNGNPNHADSWVDIAGYAKLVSDRLDGQLD